MQIGATEAAVWAQREFGLATLGDDRRTRRFVRMLARMAENPSGQLSAVFKAKELDGAYDFVENDNVTTARLEVAIGRSAAQRCAEETRVRVAVDGSSLSLTDGPKDKGFGPIGNISAGWQGLTVRLR
jgi:hypothetical protein